MTIFATKRLVYNNPKTMIIFITFNQSNHFRLSTKKKLYWTSITSKHDFTWKATPTVENPQNRQLEAMENIQQAINRPHKSKLIKYNAQIQKISKTWNLYLSLSSSSASSDDIHNESSPNSTIIPRTCGTTIQKFKLLLGRNFTLQMAPIRS